MSPVATVQELGIQSDRVGNVNVVAVSGYVDASNVEEFRLAVEPLCSAQDARVLLDLSGLCYLNSIGFGLLFSWHRACRNQGGQFALCGLKEKTRHITKELGLESLLTIYPTRDEALAALRSS
ncbi:MAG: STAS domain-containing protein [Verrucomicrobiota bacterium]